MQTQGHFSKFIITSLSTVFLSACGGSGSSETEVAKGPIQITSSNWQSSTLNSRNVSIKVTNYLASDNTWNVIITDDELTSKSHLQVHLDTDNKSSTGFQFHEEAWSKNSGVDYLIEDGILFKALTSSTEWKWEKVQEVVIQRTAGEVKISVPVSAFSGLCNKYNIGVVGLDSEWNIETYSPQSNTMTPRSIDYCEGAGSNNQPVITLNDSIPYTILQNTPFVIPPATANDAEDGDITNSITNIHNVDITTVGVYSITYFVKDSGGLSASPVTRSIIVKSATTGTGITIDGLISDWTTTSSFATSGESTFKVNDDKTNLYMLINSSSLSANKQFYIDSDNNSTTGFSLDNGSADYLLENSNLYKFTGTNDSHWSWTQVATVVPYIEYKNIIELSIPKVALGSSSNIIKLVFSNLDSNWNETLSLANEFTEYTLLIPTNTNHAPVAVNDSSTTTGVAPVIVNVLSNDSDSDGDKLTIAQVTQPKHGTTVINGDHISYTAATNYAGTDTFNYTINDGHGLTATATVSVVVTTSNQIPIAVADVTLTPMNTSIMIDVLANDTDPDNDTLVIEAVDTPDHGTATIVNGKIKYTPNAGYTGVDVFWYGINDGNNHKNSSTITVTTTSTLNRIPDAVEDSNGTSLNTPIQIDVLANDTDPDGDTLSILSFTQPSLGSTTLLSNGNILFNPLGNVGSISFSYTVSDGKGGTDIAVVTIATYDPTDVAHKEWPVISNENITAKKGDVIVLDVLANDFDPDGDTLILDQVDTPHHGVTKKVTINGKVQVELTVDTDFLGTDVFWYGVHDGYGHNGAGRVNITITP